MKEAANTLYILDEARPNTEVERFKEMMPGKVHVAMDQCEQKGSILLPLSGRISPDTGLVLASGPSRLKRTERGKDIQEPGPPMEGSRVLVMPYHGVYLDDGSRIVPATGYAWYESIPAQLLDGEVCPYFDWCLIKREKVGGMLQMTDRTKKYQTSGMVTATGPRAKEVDGARVKFDDEHAVFFQFGPVHEEMALVRLSNVFLEVTA